MTRSITVKAPTEWLSSNRLLDRRVHAAHARLWKDATIWEVRAAKLPHLSVPVIITATVHRTSNRKSDSHNLAPTLKACIDGLVQSGVLVDDDDSHVIETRIRRGANSKPAALTLTITPATKETP